MTREQQEAIAVLQEFYDYNKTLTPHGESWLQADITINRETQRNLAEALPLAIEAMSRLLTDPKTGLMPCGCGEWIYTIEKGSCMDYHVTAKCSECGWDWFSKDGVGNYSAVFGAFITNGDSKRDEAERFLIENAKANNKLNYCPNCGAKMEAEHEE